MVGTLKGSWLPMVLVASALVALAAWAALAGPAHADANHVTAGSVTVDNTGDSSTVEIRAEAPADALGAWNIDVSYDDAVITVDGCTVPGIAVCNPAFVSGETVKLTGAAAPGLTGDNLLATISFTAVGAAGECTDLTVVVNQFVDGTEQANETDPSITDGEVCVAEAATDAPTDAPTATPADLPDTGGAPASGSNAAAYLLGIIGLAVIASGAFVVSRMRRTEI